MFKEVPMGPRRPLHRTWLSPPTGLISRQSNLYELRPGLSISRPFLSTSGR